MASLVDVHYFDFDYYFSRSGGNAFLALLRLRQFPCLNLSLLKSWVFNFHSIRSQLRAVNPSLSCDPSLELQAISYVINFEFLDATYCN